MLKKNDQIEIEILRYGSNGEGIGVHEGQTVFVPYTVAGEIVKAHIIFAKKNFAIGKAFGVANKSQDREKPKCPLFFKCGGCSLQHVKYPVQLEIKRADVVQTFQKVAGITLPPCEVVGSPNEYHYRNKLSVPFSVDKNGETICGFYQAGTHNIVEMQNCPLQTESGNKALEIIYNHCKEYKVSGVTVARNGSVNGILRHAVIRAVKEGLIVVLVTTTTKFPFIDRLYANLQKNCGVVGLYLNINNENTNVIFGRKFIHKCGERVLNAVKSDIKFNIGAESFLQVNDEVVDLLYGEAVSCVEANKDDVVVNCYSGAGFLSGMLAKKANCVVGIEIVSEATGLANKLAKENNLQNVMQNITGDVEVEFPKVVSKATAEGKNIVLVLDPPRKGVDFSTLELIRKQKPTKVVYISCNPQTLSRDVGILVGSLKWENESNILKKAEDYKPLYSVSKIKCFDMFPQTAHVESVVQLDLCD